MNKGFEAYYNGDSITENRRVGSQRKIRTSWTRRNTVLLVGNFLSASGIRSVCEDLALHLTADGWSVLTTSYKQQRLLRLLDMVGTVWRRRHDYPVAQVDVYSGRAFLWAEAVCWFLRQANKPYILTLHGGNLPAFANRRHRRVKHLLRSAEIVTTPSTYLLQNMIHYRNDLFLLPNALELSAYRFRLRERIQPNLIWLRAFHALYNPSIAPRVVSLLAKDFPNVTLTMIGPDKGDKSLQATLDVAKKLNVVERIKLTGKIPKAETPNWLDKSDIFLNTTNFDNTPISVMEAMASGLCVVSTNVGGIPYLLEDERDALLVPPDDPEGMAVAVRRLLTEPGLAGKISRNAKEKTEGYDWAIILPQWKALIRAVREKKLLAYKQNLDIVL